MTGFPLPASEEAARLFTSGIEAAAMRARQYVQLDLLLPTLGDIPLRDQRETMERPFFSLSKKKRLTPIEYVSPNGEIFVNVFPHQKFGMATIWDADVLIWAASVLSAMKRRGANHIPRTLEFMPYDLLRTIGRDGGGNDYKHLRDALARLRSTEIETNIRCAEGTQQRHFSWIDAWSDLTKDEASKGMSLTLSDWFYEGVLMEGGVLSIDPAYFQISGGRERWLYRVARKHAGEGGFTIPLPTLFLKAGCEGTYRRFKFEVVRIAAANNLPGYELAIELTGKGEPGLHLRRRGE
jgi:plasmid replication initiation protein